MTAFKGLDISPEKALAELCRRSFYRFVQTFWYEAIPEDPVWNWHIEYLCNELQYLNSFVEERKPKPYDLVINVPPGSTKSTIASQMYNAWVWTRDPSQRIISSSYAKALSLSHSIKTRDIVTSDRYRRMFPDVVLKKDQSGKSDFRNLKGGQRFTTSTGGAVTGMHGHQIVVDDPLDPTQAASEVELETANNFITSTLSSRKIDKAVTPIILIMQRLHEMDPTGVLLSKKKKAVKHIRLPAEDKGNVLPQELSENYVNGLLDPVRLNREVLEEAKVDLGSYGYSGQYDQSPTPSEGGIFKKEWFPVQDWFPELNTCSWNFVADTAFTKDERNDPSGLVAYCTYQGTNYIRNASRVYLEFPELCKEVVSFASMNGYSARSKIEVEPKANGKSLVQTLKKETKLNIKEGKPPYKDKTARAKDVSPMCESGRVVLLKGAWNKDFLDEVCTFPNAPHDEFVDCLTMMLFGNKKPKKKGIKRGN